VTKSFVSLIVPLVFAAASARADVELLNVSYDPTRELYEDYNAVSAKPWQDTRGEQVSISQSHGGSGKQALRRASCVSPRARARSR
jgi:sulfate transport system substrate-binding protein